MVKSKKNICKTCDHREKCPKTKAQLEDPFCRINFRLSDGLAKTVSRKLAH
jgi:hypothetical protein